MHSLAPFTGNIKPMSLSGQGLKIRATKNLFSTLSNRDEWRGLDTLQGRSSCARPLCKARLEVDVEDDANTKTYDCKSQKDDSVYDDGRIRRIEIDCHLTGIG